MLLLLHIVVATVKDSIMQPIKERVWYVLSKSAAGGWCPPWAKALRSVGVRRIMTAKKQQLSKQDEEFLYSQLDPIFQKSKLWQGIYWLFL